MGLKLLYITNGITGSGGLERVLSVKASKLADDLGYEVHIISLNESKKETFFTFSSRIVIHTLTVGGNPLKYISQYYTGIRNKVTEIQPDIISVCDDGLKGFFIPKILGNRFPTVYERHVSRLIERGSQQSRYALSVIYFKFMLMKQLAKSFNHFVVLTEGNLKEWNQNNNLKVIPNPLPFYPSASSSLQNKKVIAVGKQSFQKAYDLLLNSWAQLPTDLSEWQLHIYGKKDESLQLVSLANKLGIINQIFLHEPEKNIEARFMESSVFVLSSRFEGFGMVIIEAMACGLPVVSFDCPHGPADIITHGKDGLLIESGDTDNFAEQLSTLMRNEQLRKQLGAAAKVTAQRYKPDKIVEEWDDLFRSLLNQYQ